VPETEIVGEEIQLVPLGEEKNLFPSTLLGALAGALRIRLTEDRLTRENQTRLLACASISLGCSEMSSYLNGALKTVESMYPLYKGEESRRKGTYGR
jgi:hypothetical protein